MKNREIVSISFLRKGSRHRLNAQKTGTFRVPVHSVRDSMMKTEYRNLTARQVINHYLVKPGDPVLTLRSGEKVRVFQGGDSNYLPAMSEGIIENHDNKFKSSQPEYSRYGSSSDLAAQLDFPWDDYYG